MKIIGLTGGIASGKSTVSSILKSLGAIIIDADMVSREVVEPGQKGLDLIVQQFGKSVLDSDGMLNRKILGDIVFKDKDCLDKLNSIIHPQIRKKIIDKINDIKDKQKDCVIIIDAALLLESGLDDLVDEVWLVYVDYETQVKRLMNRNGISLSEAISRIKSQMPVEEKLKKSDRIIDNTGNLKYTEQQVRQIWENVNSQK